MLSRRLEFRVHLHVQSVEFTLFLHYFAEEQQSLFVIDLYQIFFLFKIPLFRLL